VCESTGGDFRGLLSLLRRTLFNSLYVLPRHFVMKSHNGMSITGAFSDGGISRKFIQPLGEISYRGITRTYAAQKA